MRIFEVRKIYTKKRFGKVNEEANDLVGLFKAFDRAIYYVEDMVLKDTDFNDKKNKSWCFNDDWSLFFKVNKLGNCWFEITLHELQLVDETV
jgi:hypothetical protein